MSLVIFTGFIGLYMAPGTISSFNALISILCIAIAAGGSGALNMWYDRDIDSIMSRTMNRPLPAGKIPPKIALYFGLFLAILSVIIMGITINVLSSGILAFTVFFYAFIYTVLLKRHTPQNIVIGGIAGALPPVIGWAAVTGNITIEPIIMFLIIFLWTPPHFWSLSLDCSDDYKKAKIPMMPITSGILQTKKQIFLYTVALVITTTLPFFYGMSGNYYLAASLILGGIFLHHTLRIFVDSRYNKKTFIFSIFYLFLIFFFLAVDRL